MVRSKNIWAVMCVSLLFFSMIASASNISLNSSIGVHTFDSLDESVLHSDGSFTIINQDVDSISLSVSVENVLNAVDLNKTTGLPRMHKVSDSVVFHAFPVKEWFSFEESSFVIPANGVKTVNYSLDIPVEELPGFVGRSDGLLGYIQVSGGKIGSGTASVGVNYQFKVFTVFNADLPSDSEPVGFPYLLLFVMSLAIALVAVVFFIRLHVLDKFKEEMVEE